MTKRQKKKRKKSNYLGSYVISVWKSTFLKVPLLENEYGRECYVILNTY